MSERKSLGGGPLSVFVLVILLLVLWLGFLVHHDHRFAGSFWGGVLGVSGAVLLLVPMTYTFVKRIGPIKRWLTPRVSLSTVLSIHVYAGLIGAILGLLHTGHKFVSPIGVALTATMFVVVLSGFAGRYLLRLVYQEVSEKKLELAGLQKAYQQTAGELATHPDQLDALRPLGGFWARTVGSLSYTAFAAMPGAGPPTPAVRALRLAESMADLEYAIGSHERLKRWFAGWLWVHIITSVVLYALLATHVWAGIHFGLRWWR